MTQTAASKATELYFRRRNFSPVQKEFQKCIVSLTVFKNHRKKNLIQHCERSELRLHFEWIKKAKNGQFGEFLNPRYWSQTVLPGRSD